MRSAFVDGIILIMILILAAPSAAIYTISDELTVEELSSLEEFVEWAEDYSSREQYIPDTDRPSLKTVEATALLKQLENGHPLRMRIILAVRHNASPKDLLERQIPHTTHILPDGQINLSWRILLDLGVLHDRMTLEQAVVILGSFHVYGSHTEGTAHWTYMSGDVSQPNLQATIRNRNLEHFKITR